ncbi:MAG: efflux RND transporter periplasmic adaptor subunit [Bacteroidota bacterium]|nr:efflux RND transporter periplasmic adaptor subunit [Bacteroidota bacterium]
MKKVLLCAILTCTLISCSKQKGSDTSSISQIPVFTVNFSNTVFNDNIVTDIQAIKNVEIRTRIKGFLERILVDEGASVRKGQPLFRLASPEYTAELTKAKSLLQRAIAERKAANLEVERVKMLVDKNVVAKSELILAESKAQVALAEENQARASLQNATVFMSYCTITAPFDGVINRIPLKIGSLLNEGDLLTSISDISNIYAYFNLSETDYLRYLKAKQKGDSIPDENNVQLELADGSLYKHKGKIETVASEIEGSTGAITFRARFVNPERLLKHGATGTIRLSTQLDKVIMIPQKAVLEIQDKNYVFLVQPNNRVKIHEVKLGNRNGLFYMVQSGLSVNDKIVLEGVQILRDGDSIKPVYKKF